MASKAHSGELGFPFRIVLPPVPFPVAVSISALLHVILVLTWLALPRVEPGSAPPVYRVRLVEAPARPEARPLEVLREAVPSVQPEPPPRSEARALPKTELPSLPNAPSSAPPRPKTESPLAASPAQPSNPLAAPALPGRPNAQSALAPLAPAAALAPPSGAPAPLPQAKDLPKAPALPPAPPSLSAQEQPSAAARPGADEAAEPVVPLPPPPAEAEKPAARKPATAMDTLRNKVRQPLPAPRNEAPPLEPLPSSPLADLARRRYRNGIQSRVRDNHTYPAEFSCGIEAVVRITLARDGALVGSQLLQTSGDSRYDYAVDLTIRATRFQPLPDELPGDTFTENLRFTPKRCPSSNP